MFNFISFFVYFPILKINIGFFKILFEFATFYTVAISSNHYFCHNCEVKLKGVAKRVKKKSSENS